MTAADGAAGGIAAPARADLRRQLGRSRRRERRQAALLVAPLVLFLFATFLAPIAAMLWRGVSDEEVSRILPRVTAALAGWDGRALPPEAAFAALIEDMRAARDAGTLASAGTRLNYDINGFRTLVFATARRLPAEQPADARTALIAIDAKWGDVETWGAIRRAAGPATDFYLLAALDLKRNAAGDVVAAPANEAVFVNLLLRTLGISALVTLVCLLLGYPVAYYLSSLPARTANLLMVLVLLPFWTSLLVRLAAWVVMLQRDGIVNNLLLRLDLVSSPLSLLYSRFAVVVAMVHVLLPFMVLPLMSVMKGIPGAHLRAAASLGAPPRTVFRRIYLPQTLPGIAAGTLLVFIQALGYYITPALVGGGDDQMIGSFIAFYATRTINWGMAAALSFMLLGATVLLYFIYSRLVGFERLRLG